MTSSISGDPFRGIAHFKTLGNNRHPHTLTTFNLHLCPKDKHFGGCLLHWSRKVGQWPLICLRMILG
jgi:hypothetical protein